MSLVCSRDWTIGRIDAFSLSRFHHKVSRLSICCLDMRSGLRGSAIYFTASPGPEKRRPSTITHFCVCAYSYAAFETELLATRIDCDGSVDCKGNLNIMNTSRNYGKRYRISAFTDGKTRAHRTDQWFPWAGGIAVWPSALG